MTFSMKNLRIPHGLLLCEICNNMGQLSVTMIDLELAVAEVPGLTNRLRELRKGRGLSLEALEERTGVSVSTLSRLETGGMKMTAEYLSILSRAIDCHPAELIADLGVVARDDQERELLVRLRTLDQAAVLALLATARAMPPRE
jgi:transcriptional regulator with XRE-family HTH domain